MEGDHHRAQMHYQLGWADTSGTCELEGRPRMSSGGDKLMANSGFSKSIKANIWGWQLSAKWAYGVIRPMHQYCFHVYIITVNGEM